MADTCLYCEHDLTGPAARPAFDPWLGRLWRVCASCRRWNVVPLEDRWESMERYERLARDRGRAVLRTEHLDLVEADGRQLIRVGRAPRPELAGWRYSDVLPRATARGIRAWLRRLVLGVPSTPFGYGAGYGALMTNEVEQQRRWFASPFIDDAPTLTAAFLQVPLAERCPSCGDPLALAPWAFQAIRLVGGGGSAVAARCGVCGEVVAVPIGEARGALRLGLAVVNRRYTERALVEGAADLVDRAQGPVGFLERLGEEEASVGELDLGERLALGFALDEQTEAELLEAEWREAEELAAIVDRDLTRVEGFEEFRRRVLS